MFVTTHPSCGYAPLQRLTTNRCIALLVRRSRRRFVQLKRATRNPVFLPINLSLRRNEVTPLMRLRPLQGSTQRGPPTLLQLRLRGATKAAQSATLMEFLPLRRLSPSESTPRRFATPTTFRPQGFSPSRRLAPRSDARPCFMPVTPMGFRSPGVFPRCQVPPARRPWNYPLGVSPPQSAVNSAMQGARFSANPVKCLRHGPFFAFRALLRQ